MLTRSGRLALVVALVVVAWGAPRCAGRVADLEATAFPVVLAAALELALLAVATWLLVVTGLGGLGGHGVRVARRLTPRLARALLFAGVAGVLATGPATAQDSPVDPAELDGLSLPDRPSSMVPPVEPGSAPVPSTAPTTPRGDDATVEVRPGDSLWSIATTHAPTSTPTHDLGAATRRWFDTNRDVIGDDPDLIHPGQRLTVPTEDLP